MEKTSVSGKPTQTVFNLLAASMLVAICGCSFLGEKWTPLESAAGVHYLTIFDYAGQQLNQAYVSLDGGYPVYSSNKTWAKTETGEWGQGYYPGMLWLLYQGTGNTSYFDLARNWVTGLEGSRNKSSSAGLGTIFFPGFVLGYQITGNSHYREMALEAAQTLSSRFNSKAGFFPSWGEQGDSLLGRRLTVETMMDLELLYWASQASGKREYAAQANAHAIFTMRNLIAWNGKILESADFDVKTGMPCQSETAALSSKMYADKGYDSNTAWALGQALGIYGFTSCYKSTTEPVFLNAAKFLANHFLENLPPDNIPNWDFELPDGQPKEKDAAAAAVAASALLKLSRLCPVEADRKKFFEAAKMMVAVLSKNYLTLDKPAPGVLTSSMYNKKLGLGVGEATSWGDFFYLEALMMLKDAGS